MRVSTSIVLAFITIIGLVSAEDAEVTVITYGSAIKLEHKATNHRLHSHDVSYGTGSRQQSVTGHHDLGDSNSFWIVKTAHGAARPLSGKVVKCGDTIRLQHLNTRKNLHSHRHYAPLNRDYEVSAYRHNDGQWAEGDQGDNWVVDCVGREKEWGRFKDIRLMHEQDKTYMTATSKLQYGDPIPNQLHVSAGSRKTGNTIWRTNEGYFVAPLKENKD